MNRAEINNSIDNTMNIIMKICTISGLVFFGMKPCLKVCTQETGEKECLSRVGI